MKIERSLWGAGTILSSQQFQLQACWEAYTNECIAPLGLAHLWGVLTAVFDKDTLALGQLKANHLCVRFADGSLIDADREDQLPPVLELATVLPAWKTNSISLVPLLVYCAMLRESGPSTGSLCRHYCG